MEEVVLGHHVVGRNAGDLGFEGGLGHLVAQGHLGQVLNRVGQVRDETRIRAAAGRLPSGGGLFSPAGAGGFHQLAGFLLRPVEGGGGFQVFGDLVADFLQRRLVLGIECDDAEDEGVAVAAMQQWRGLEQS